MPVVFEFSNKYKKQFEKLPTDIQQAAVLALKKFKENPNAKSLRKHRLTDVKPPIWKIDVFTNHSWQIAFRLEGERCTLLRIGSHSYMDKEFR